MGHCRQSDFFKAEDCRVAYLSEMEFSEMARVIKMVAGELHQETGPVIDELARGGLDAALGALAASSGSDASGAYYQRRDEWRASQGLPGGI